MANRQDYVLLLREESQVLSERMSPRRNMDDNHDIPSWEKEFCYKIGSFEWETFLEAKRNAQYYSNVMEWNDSAGKEAFQIAKSRFYAQATGVRLRKSKSSFLPDLEAVVNCYYKLCRKFGWPKLVVNAGKKAKRIFLLTLICLLAD